MTTPIQDVPTDALLKVLADHQRRTVLHYLRQNGEDPVAIDDLTDALVAPNDERGARQPDDERRRLRINLQHLHLPRLADIGTINYDPQAATVRYTPVDQVEALLEFVTHDLD